MSGRPAIVSIDDDIDGVDARITVTLDYRSRHVHGQAVGTSDEQTRLAGEATLRAVEELTKGAIGLELLAVATTEVGIGRVAVAQIRTSEDQVLVGTALQGEEDGKLAAVRAVMDALNRRLGRIL